MGVSGRPLPQKKNGHFLPKNGLKMPILATNSVFWALVVTSRPPPPPYFAGN